MKRQMLRQPSICQTHFDDNGATHIEHLSDLSIRVKPDRLRKTGIICTIGPACCSVEKLTEMIQNGLNIARLNFSHGSHEYHAKTIASIREAAKACNNAVVAIALDTKGPEIRTGMLSGGKDVELHTGNSILLSIQENHENSGTSTMIYVDYKSLPQAVKKGSRIYIDDGLISLLVDDVSTDCVVCTVENGGMLGSRKGVNLPGTRCDLPAVTDKDIADLRFGVEQGVDIIFASFIRDGDGVRKIRQVLGEDGQRIRVIAKIESEEGVLNAEEIIRESDGIMVARGDLGIEIASEKKMLSAKCNLAGKPCICATQMLESMITKPRPTRAECSDVANAVLDGCDCVMLSGETAKGEYPLESLQMMHSTCKEAEAAFYHSKYFEELLQNTDRPTDTTNTIAIAAVTALTCNQASAIILLTDTGRTARMCSRYKPPVPIIAVCRKEQVARQLHLNRSVFPVVFKDDHLNDWHDDIEARIQFGISQGKALKCIRRGDQVVIITGWKKGPGSSNTMRIVVVE